MPMPVTASIHAGCQIHGGTIKQTPAPFSAHSFRCSAKQWQREGYSSNQFDQSITDDPFSQPQPRLSTSPVQNDWQKASQEPYSQPTRWDGYMNISDEDPNVSRTPNNQRSNPTYASQPTYSTASQLSHSGFQPSSFNSFASTDDAIDAADPTNIPGLKPVFISNPLEGSAAGGSRPAARSQPPAADSDMFAYSLADPLMDQEISRLRLDLEEDIEEFPAVTLGGTEFRDVTAMKLHFRGILITATADAPLSPQRTNELVDLIRKGHRDPDSKIGPGVSYAYVGTHPVHTSGCFMLQRVDGSSIDFSYIKCISQLYGDAWGYATKGPYKEALRVARAHSTFLLTRPYFRNNSQALAHTSQRLSFMRKQARLQPLELTAPSLMDSIIDLWSSQSRSLDWAPSSHLFEVLLVLQAVARACKVQDSCRKMVRDANLMPGVLLALKQAGRWSPQLLTCVVWELQSLRYRPPDWMLEMVSDMCNPSRTEGGDMALMGYLRLMEAMTALGLLREGDFLQSVLSTVGTGMREEAGQQLGVQYLVAALTSCARLQQQLGTESMVLPLLQMIARSAGLLLQRQSLECLRPSTVALLLWAWYTLGMAVPDFLLQAGSQAAARTLQPPVFSHLWVLLIRAQYQPSAEVVGSMLDWLAIHKSKMRPEVMRRMAWVISCLVTQPQLEEASSELHSAAVLLGTHAAKLQPACPLPTALMCLWAVLTTAEREPHAGVLESSESPSLALWDLWAEATRDSSAQDALKQYPPDVVMESMQLAEQAKVVMQQLAL